MIPSRPVVAACATLVALISMVASGQSIPTWTVTRDMRIDATEHDLSPIGWLAVASNGTIVISQRQDSLLRFFTARGESLGAFGRGGAGPGEFRVVALHGWMGDTLWVNDPELRRTTFISPDRKLVRTVAQLNTVRLAGGDEARQVFAVFPRAWFPDGGSLVVLIEGAGADGMRWPGATPGTPLLRVDSVGVFQSVAGTAPENPCAVRYSLPGGGGSASIPYCGVPMDALAADGSRYAVITTEEQTGRRVAWRVTVTRSRGDTIFSRRYEDEALALPRRIADSVLSARLSSARFPQQREAMRGMKVPAVYAPYSRILLGADDSIWIERYTASGNRLWQVLDAIGNPTGQLQVPRAVHLLVASRSAVWATDTDDDGLQHIVRYRVSR